MAVGYKSKGLQMPLPQAIADLLSVVPSEGKKSNYKNALEWIFSKGLYFAAKKRHELAKQASDMEINDNGRRITLKQKLGRPVYDHEVYSPQAWAQIPELKKLFDQTYAAKPAEYEPQQFLLPSTGDKVLRINMSQVNELLRKMGKQPFQFGGPNGLIEYMENGSWAQPRSAQGPIPHQGPHHNRHGFDLSKPQLSFHPDSGTYMYHFSDFDPPQNSPSGQRTQLKGVVNSLLRNSQELYDKYVSGSSDLGDVSPEVKGSLEKLKGVQPATDVLSGDTNTIADEQGFTNRTPKDRKLGAEAENDPDTYAFLAMLVRLGVDEAIESGRIEYDQKQKIIDQILPPSNMNVIRQYLASDSAKKGSHRRSNAIINLGADRLRKIGLEKALADYLNPVISHMKKFGVEPDFETLGQELDDAISHQDSNKTPIKGQKMDLTPVGEQVPFKNAYKPVDDAAIRQLLDNGYRWSLTRDERQQGLKEPAANRNFATLEKGDHELRMRRLQDGGWALTNPEESHPGEPLGKEFSKSVSPFLLGNTASMKFNPSMPEITPVHSSLQDQLQTDMIRNPEKYGLGLGEEEHFGNKTAQKVGDLDDAVKKAVQSAMSYSGKTRNSVEMNDLYNNALMGMLRHSADYRFKYGDVSPRNAKLKNYLAMPNLGNISEPKQQDAWINKMQAIQKAGKEPQSENQQDSGTYVPQNILNSFLVNGKWWRHAKMAGFVQQLIRKENAPDKEKVIQGTDDEGETHNIAHNVAAGGAAGGVGRLTSTLRSDDTFDSGNKGRKRPVRDPLTGEYDPKALVGMDPEKRTGQVSNIITGGETKEGILGVFKHDGIAQNPERKDPNNIYNRRYSQFFNMAQGKLGGSESSNALGKMLSTNAIPDTDPETARAALDAIGDVAAKQLVRIADLPAKTPEDVNEFRDLLNDIFSPKGKYFIGNFASNLDVDVESSLEKISEFIRGREDMMKLLSQPRIEKKKPLAPPAPPGAQPTTVGAQVGGKITDGGWSSDTGPVHRPLRRVNNNQLIANNPSEYRKLLLRSLGTPMENELRRLARDSGLEEYIDTERKTSGTPTEHFRSYKQWKLLKETDAIYDGSKPTTFNWWGAVGLPGGKIIDGDVPVKKKHKKEKKK